MKNNCCWSFAGRVLMAAVALSTFNSQRSTTFAQGSLAPPGPPAPGMKTLQQIEPRTPISSAPFTITNSGSYYLTTNLNVTGGDAITINADQVTLDLKGFTIRSTAASATGNGILFNSGSRNIAIGNGFIQGGVTNNGSGVYNGTGFGSGISFFNTAPVNVLVSRVSVSGCLFYGIFLASGDSVAVESCTVRTTGSYGIVASTVKSCSAMDCGGTAIFGEQVSDCRGQSSIDVGVFANIALNCLGDSGGSGTGLYANSAQNCYGSSISGTGLWVTTAHNCYGRCTSGAGTGLYAYDTAQNCSGYSDGGSGILMANGGTLIGCKGFSYGTAGINAPKGCTIKDCTIQGCSGTGLTAGANCTIENSTASQNGASGIVVGSGCAVRNCTVSQNGGHGISVDDGSTVQGCTVRTNFGDGIRIADRCLVIENQCRDNGEAGNTNKAGIHATGNNNRIEANNAIENKMIGIKVEAFNSLIIKNTARGNGFGIGGLDFDIALGHNNSFGQILAVPGENFVNSNPWANIAF